MVDPTGHIPFFIVTGVVGAFVGGVIGGFSAANNGGNVWAGIATGAAIGALVGVGAGMAAGAVFAGSLTASTGAVIAGGSALVSTVASGGLGAGATYISNNFSQAVNKLTPAAAPDPLKQALKRLDASGIRPGQTEISREKIMNLVDNFSSFKAKSSIYSSGGTRYLVEGHHTTVASTILGRGTCMNMGAITNEMPSAMNVYWTKKWYEFGKVVIKIMD